MYPINDYSKSIATREIYLRGLISQTNGRDGLVGIIQYFFGEWKGMAQLLRTSTKRMWIKSQFLPGINGIRWEFFNENQFLPE